MNQRRFTLLVFIGGFALSGLGVACGGVNDTPGQVSEMRPTVISIATHEPTEPSLPQAFSVSRIADWAEAERAVGYPIVRSVSFPLTWPYLFVQPAIDAGGSIPRTATALHTIDGVGVKLIVAPLSTWNDGALQRGEPLEIGSRRGWLSKRGSTSSYTFPCGASQEFGEVWCQVEVDATPPDLLTRFVSDLVP